jgi:hypothetical protein
MGTWRRHFLYSKESIRTTWKLRIGMPIVLILIGALTRGFWAAQIGRSLVCTRDLAPSDVILIENFDPNYLLFERAAAFEKAGLAPRALVPVPISPEPEGVNPISKSIAEVMARQARLGAWGMIPMRVIEPIIDLCITNRHYGHKNAGSSEALIKERRSSGRFRAFLVMRQSAAMSAHFGDAEHADRSIVNAQIGAS